MYNQPIYSYNIKDCNLCNFPDINYEYPSDYKKQLTKQDQYKINASMMFNLQKFFGTDRFNSRNLQVNIDLSWIIYVIYKIISTIDKNTMFYDELLKIYSKYNVVLTKYEYKMDNCQKYGDLLSTLEELYDIDFKTEEIIERINNGLSYKSFIKSKEVKLKKVKKELRNISSNMKVQKIGSKYNMFPANQKYKDYTNIDVSYFNEIK